MSELHGQVTKEYPVRGPLQQFRLANSVPFSCFRCNRDKKSTLIIIYQGDWDKKLCNACYGTLLSIYNIAKGAESDDVKAEKLSGMLLSLVKIDQIQAEKKQLYIAHHKSHFLSDITLRFLATAEHICSSLAEATSLDWSLPIIGLSKAVEIEFILRLLDPLAERLKARDIHIGSISRQHSIDRVARYCMGKAPAPELGALREFLVLMAQNPIDSKEFVIIQEMNRLLSKWPNSSWILEGALADLDNLRKNYRNKAAHITLLEQKDYIECANLVLGKDGMLWKLIISTQPRHKS